MSRAERRATTRPLHFFGRVGTALLAAGFLSLAYLTVLWTQSIPIGTRPLLLFGVLLVLIGGQTVFTGLLADLIVNINQAKHQEFPLRYLSDAGVDRTARPAAVAERASARVPIEPGRR